MDQSNNPHPAPEPSPVHSGLLVAHVVNIALIVVIFVGTHYFLTTNQCTPEASFRWSVIAAAVYGLLSAVVLSKWLHRKIK